MIRMKRTAVLLGSRRIRKDRSPTTRKRDTIGDLEEEDWEYQYDLLTPDKVVVADDTNAYQLFGDAIFTAPQEDLLEGEILSLLLFLFLTEGFSRILLGTWLQTTELYDQGGP